MKTLSPESLKPLLTDQNELAFLDVREHGQYGEGHPFFSVPLPYSRLEQLAERLLPNKSVRLVLLDDADGVAPRAAARFESIGYDNVYVLEGGAPACSAAGDTLYNGVNVPSKTYGELLEHEADTPRITASELNAMREKDPSIVVLDGRSPEEYLKMSLPGALCCPNAELGYRVQSLVPNEDTPIVINCAGRTRSILGVEGLRVLNVKNPIFALENGTQGWRLAGLELANGVTPQVLPDPDEQQFSHSADLARALIAAAQLELVQPETVSDWCNESGRTTYLFDVRTKAEFEQAHWKGSRHAPGGQLVQTTDQYVAVRYARIVLSDDNHLRAATTAIRLQDMGHDVCILDVDARSGESSEENLSHAALAQVDYQEIPRADDAMGLTILDASAGMQFREAHIDGATWVTRARLDQLNLDSDEQIILTGQDTVLLDGAAVELELLGYANVLRCMGSTKLWLDAGYKVIASPDEPTNENCIDYLFFVHDRHDDNMDAARRYLEWEVGLVDQLDEQERSVLRPRSRFL